MSVVFFVIPEAVVGNPIKKALTGLQWHCHPPPEHRIEGTVTNIFTNVNIFIYFSLSLITLPAAANRSGAAKTYDSGENHCGLEADNKGCL